MNVIYGRLHEALNRGEPSRADALLADVEELLRQLSLSDVRRPPDVFYDFCLKFFDRMLGENTTLCDPYSSWIANDHGRGWLRRIAQVEREANLLIQNKGPSYAPVPVSRLQLGERLVQILSLKGKLIDLLYCAVKDCEMKLSLLPLKGQLKILQHSMYRYVETDNQRVYIDRMKRPLLHARQRATKTDESTVTIDTYDYFLVCLLRHPLLEPDATMSAVRRPTQYDSPSNSALVYMQALEKEVKLSAVGLLRTKGESEWLRPAQQQPYLALIRNYLDGLLDPRQRLFQQQAASSPRDHRDLAAGGGGGGISTGTGTPGTPAAAGSTSVAGRNDIAYLTHDAEEFVKLAAEIWMDTPAIVRLYSEYARTQRAAGTAGRGAGNYPKPYDIITLDSRKDKWTIRTLQCVYLLVRRLLSDPRLLPQYQLIASLAGNTSSTRGGSLGSSGRGRGGPSAPSSPRSPRDQHYMATCPPTVEFLQQPLFDMLRCIFSRDDRFQCSDTGFALAVDIWLFYIQPWGQAMLKGHASTNSGRDLTTRFKYQSNWRPYVAANLHFYTTLLTSFFRAMGKLDLSQSTVEGVLHLQTLERVLQVFNDADLVQTVYEFVYDLRPDNRDPPEYTSDREREILLAHQRHLYPDPEAAEHDFHGYVYPKAQAKEYCLAIIDTLQRMRLKSLYANGGGFWCRFDRIFFWGSFAHVGRAMNDFFTLTPDREDEVLIRKFNGRLDSCTASLSYLMGIPVPSPADSVKNADSVSKERELAAIHGEDQTDPNASIGTRDVVTGKLTQRGKDALLKGHLLCRKQGIRYSGDPLDAPICSYEWPALTRLLVKASKDLNGKFNLPKETSKNKWSYLHIWLDAWVREDLLSLPETYRDSFRFNLRGFADVQVSSTVVIILATVLYSYNIMIGGPLGLFAIWALGLMFIVRESVYNPSPIP